MFFDNIILFLNVLEQFAIRVTIFGLDIEDIIKYVNSNFFSNDDYINKLVAWSGVTNEFIDPNIIVKNSIQLMDQKLIYRPLTYTTHFKYVF